MKTIYKANNDIYVFKNKQKNTTITRTTQAEQTIICTSTNAVTQHAAMLYIDIDIYR